MEWQVMLVLLIAVPVILIPAVLVWYINIGGIYAAICEGRKIRISETISRTVRRTVIVIVPLAIYASLIWFSFGHFGWQVALALGLALPILLLVPALVWAAVVSGLYQVAREAVRRRVTISRRASRIAGEPIPRKVT
jgi:hypothetical protein